jgi:hypothetical protein
LFVFLAAGCEHLTTASTAVAEIEVTVEPATVEARPATESEFQWVASFTVRMTETAGRAATIDSVNATVVEAAGGIEVISAEPELFLGRPRSRCCRIFNIRWDIPRYDLYE